MDVIDFHTHAFPDALAERTIPRMLQAAAQLPGGEIIRAHSDGKLGGLLASMDQAGVGISVVANIATRPSQTANILDWCTTIEGRQAAGRRLVMFPSVHPADPEAPAWLDRIIAAGFKGIKFHPYYQGFRLDDPAFVALVRQAHAGGLAMLCHCGFDIAYPRDRVADPALVLELYSKVPGVRFVAAHLGGWEDWQATESLLLGQPVWLDTAFCLQFLAPERAARLLMTHPGDFLVWGSDSPWTDQATAMAELRALLDHGLTTERLAAILGGNARRLLALD